MYEYFAMYLGDDLTEFNARLSIGWRIDQTHTIGTQTLVIIARRVERPERNNRIERPVEMSREYGISSSETSESTPGFENPFTYTSR